MIDLKNIIKRDCIDWNNDPYIYEKNNEDKYEYITFGDFIKHSLGIAKYLIDNGYKDKASHSCQPRILNTLRSLTFL